MEMPRRKKCCMHLEFVDSTSNDWLFGKDVLVTDKSSYSSSFCLFFQSFFNSGHFSSSFSFVAENFMAVLESAKALSSTAMIETRTVI